MSTTDPDLWKCPRCGLPLRICGGNCRRRAGRKWRGVLAAGVALALLATPAQAGCHCLPVEPEPVVPIVGPGIGPCSSDAPHWCYPQQVWLPILAVAP